MQDQKGTMRYLPQIRRYQVGGKATDWLIVNLDKTVDYRSVTNGLSVILKKSEAIQ